MKPTQDPFGHPAIRTQPAAVVGVALGQVRFDAAAFERVTVWLRVVGPLGVQGVGTLLGVSRLPSRRGDAVHQGEQLCHVVSVRVGDRHVERDADRIGVDMVFTPRFPAIGRVWAGLLTSSHRPHRRTVDRRSRPVDLIRRPKAFEQLAMQFVADTGRLPVPQSSSAGHPAAIAHLLRKHLRRDAAIEHEDDPGRRRTVIHPPPGLGSYLGINGSTTSHNSSETNGCAILKSSLIDTDSKSEDSIILQASNKFC